MIKDISFSSLFHLLVKKISQALLEISQEPREEDFDRFGLGGISSRTKRLINHLFRKGIIKEIRRNPRIYYDEPKIIQYQVVTPSQPPEISLYSDGYGSFTGSSGADFGEEKALMKAIGEGLERFSLCCYREKNLLLAPYSKISRKALNPLSFVGLSPAQRQANPRWRIEETSLFRWAKGFSLLEKKEVFLPAQLVYIGYKYHPQEPVIQQQLSTGAAAAESPEEALYRGICEAVERDAFMITFFNKLSPPLIDSGSINDENLQKLFRDCQKRYNLELYLIDMTTDIGLPTVMALIIDRSGGGPAVHLGNSTDLNIKKAVWGAVCESIKGRIFFRSASQKEKINPSKIKTFVERSNFWHRPEMIEKVEFLFRGSKKKIGSEEELKYQNFSGKEKLKIVLNLLKKRKIELYGIDITLPPIKEENIWIMKVVSPQLQPLYLNEEMRQLWGERMFKVPQILGYRSNFSSLKELNPLPHPFL